MPRAVHDPTEDKGRRRRRKKPRYADGKKSQPMKNAANPTERNIGRARHATKGDGPSGRDARMKKRAKRIATAKAALGDELL